VDAFLTLLLGHEMSASMRIWSALAPALLISTLFILGFVVFLGHSAVWGLPKDPETIERGGSMLVGAFLRHYFFWLIRPLWSLVVKSGVPPITISTLSVVLGIGSGFAAAAGRFALAGWLFIFSGILDTLDGRLARFRDQVTRWGAAIDSTLDRVSDMALLMGLAWYYRHSWLLLMCLLSMTGSSLVPYVRARGEGLGVSIKDGLAQRVERVVCLGVGVALSPVIEAVLFPGDPHPMHWLAAVALVALAITSNLTAAMRLLSLIWTLKEREGQSSTAGASELLAVPRRCGRLGWLWRPRVRDAACAPPTRTPTPAAYLAKDGRGSDGSAVDVG
jgi:phosphatidylglycerophosphate synthase